MKKEEQFYERLVLFLLIVGAAFLYFSVRGAKRAAFGEDLASMDFPRGTLLLLMLLCGGRLVFGWLANRGEKGEGRLGLQTGEGADSVSGQENRNDGCQYSFLCRPVENIGVCHEQPDFFLCTDSDLKKGCEEETGNSGGSRNYVWHLSCIRGSLWRGFPGTGSGADQRIGGMGK